jgi:CHAT domain-containing protein
MPAAALREATAELRKLKRWEAPYYWAGFVQHGEWRWHERELMAGMPAAALREATAELRKLKRWEAPYYWAGFVQHG